MKLATVLTAVNTNDEYLQFIPNFIKHWKYLFPDIIIVIVLVSSKIPNEYKMYSKYIKLFPEIPNIPTAFQAMCIRELYPCIIDVEGGILITDIDMMPMNRSYYQDSIENISDEKFVIYRDVLKDEYPMCYNIATSKIWSNVFGVSRIDDIKNTLIKLYENLPKSSNYWEKIYFCNTDQKYLYKKLNDFNCKTGNLIKLNDKICGFNRLDRIYMFNTVNKSDIKNRKYTDFHSYRKYQKDWKETNDIISKLLCED